MQALKSMSATAKAVAVLVTLLVLAVVFWAGISVGRHRAEFSYGWDRHYADNFAGPGSPFGSRGMMGGMMGWSSQTADQASIPNGASGKIVAVNLPTIAIAGLDSDDVEKVVVINSNTSIRYMHSAGTTTDLKVGSVVTAIGTPDAQGRIVASFVRIMPNFASSTYGGRGMMSW